MNSHTEKSRNLGVDLGLTSSRSRESSQPRDVERHPRERARQTTKQRRESSLSWPANLQPLYAAARAALLVVFVVVVVSS